MEAFTDTLPIVFNGFNNQTFEAAHRKYGGKK